MSKIFIQDTCEVRYIFLFNEILIICYMEAHSSDRKLFTLTNQGNTIGPIRYENYV